MVKMVTVSKLEKWKVVCHQVFMVLMVKLLVKPRQAISVFFGIMVNALF